MADKEKKEAQTEKEVKASKKTKKDKPKFFSKVAAWFKSCKAWLKTCKAELKRIDWASWSSVKSNTVMVLFTIIVVSAAIFVVDMILMNAIKILAILI